LLVRLLYGGRVSLGVGLAATFVALTIGVVIRSCRGFFRRKLDAFMMRTVDIVYSLPFPIFVILLMVFFGRNIILSLLPSGRRVAHDGAHRPEPGDVVKKMEFIEAARSLGFGRVGLFSATSCPTSSVPSSLYHLTIPAVMLLEAFLSFWALAFNRP
jgi:oligopeptide transport system permease protein